MTKKLTSLVLALVMCLSLCVPALAVEDAAADVYLFQPEVVYLDDGVIYAEKTAERTVTVVVDELNNRIEFTMIDAASPNSLYQLYLYDYPNDSAYTQQSFWDNIIETGVANLQDATMIDISDMRIWEEELEEPINVTNARSSAVADLTNDLRGLVGNEYSKKSIASTSNYLNTGLTMRLYESMTYMIYETGNIGWNIGSAVMTIGSFITGVLSLRITTKAVSIMSILFGVGSSAAAVIASSGTLNRYSCRAFYQRWVSVNGSQYTYTATEKSIDYQGLEDKDGTGRAKISPEEPKTVYSYSSTYFNTYSLQYDDALLLYQNVGQQP